ncbi:MAG: hypothetical protein ACW976_04055 [Candidatus Ranarchaeia archaeon]|jgi:hypothetical protein
MEPTKNNSSALEDTRSKAYATLPVISSEAMKELSKDDRDSLVAYYLGVIAGELRILNESMHVSSKD